MSADGVVYQEVVINDDDAVIMILQFLSNNGMRLAEVYVEPEVVGETHSHQYSYDDGFAGRYEWGGSSSNYERGGYTGGYELGGSLSNYGEGSSARGVTWEEYPQHAQPVPFVEPDNIQWHAWGPEWADIENTLRSGCTSHEREDDAGDAGHDDHPGPSCPFSSTDEGSEEDLRSVCEEEDTDEID
ncbi:unnamed protein product [Linum trigynum]|uniref:Uncharacterized protein n=1 Tax=Linum trigynum TaxID=586398 RepID=A0AAV2E8B3_9ROSI